MKTFDRQMHFGEYHGTSRESLFAHSSAFRFFFLGGVGDVRARRDTAPLHRAGDGVFSFVEKGCVGEEGPAGDFAFLLVYPSSLRMTLDSTSTFTFTFG